MAERLEACVVRSSPCARRCPRRTRGHCLAADRLVAADGKARRPPSGRRSAPRLRHAAAAALACTRSRRPRRSQRLAAALSARDQTIEDAIRAEGQHQAAEQAGVANLITSLRLISTFDWSEFFESVSLVEQVLQRDPAGVYGRMDFRSRDRYRHAVEELAVADRRGPAAAGAQERGAGATGARYALIVRRRITFTWRWSTALINVLRTSGSSRGSRPSVASPTRPFRASPLQF